MATKGLAFSCFFVVGVSVQSSSMFAAEAGGLLSLISSCTRLSGIAVSFTEQIWGGWGCSFRGRCFHALLTVEKVAVDWVFDRDCVTFDSTDVAASWGIIGFLCKCLTVTVPWRVHLRGCIHSQFPNIGFHSPREPHEPVYQRPTVNNRSYASTQHTALYCDNHTTKAPSPNLSMPGYSVSSNRASAFPNHLD